MNTNKFLPLPKTAVLLFMIVCNSCTTYAPRYTPETVAPPESLEEAWALINANSAISVSGNLTSKPVETPPASVTPTVVDITLDSAIHIALANNLSLEVESFTPEIAKTAIAEARAAFDPTLSLNMDYSEVATPGNSDSSASSTQSGTANSATSLGQTVSAIENVLQQTQQLASMLQEEDVSVVHSTGFGADSKLSQPLPTGTELYISGGFSRDNASTFESPEYQGNWSVGISQSLLRGFGSGINLVTLRKSRNDAASSEMAFRNYIMQLVAQVESTYWELALAQEALGIRQFSLELAQEQLKLNEALIEVGKLSGSARVSAEAEVAAQKAELSNAKADLQSQAVELWRLLNPDTMTVETIQFMPIVFPETCEPALSADESSAIAKLFRPDLAQARLDVANGDLTVIQTKNGLLPDLTAFASYGLNSSGSGSSSWSQHLNDSTYDQFQTGISFSMTLGNRAEKARYRRAKLQQAQAEAAVKAMEQLIESDVQKSIIEVLRQFEQITASQHELLSRTEELNVETEQFRLGRSTNLNVLLVQEKLIEAKLQEATSRARFLQAITTLHQTEGTLLVRRGILVTNKKEI